MVEFWKKKKMHIKEALYQVHKVWNLISHQNIMRSWRKLYVGLEMDDDTNPFSGFEEEGDDQFQKEMKELIEKEAQFDKVDKENIKQWLENDAEIPRHEISGDAEGEEDKIVSSVCVPLQAALGSADLLRHQLH